MTYAPFMTTLDLSNCPNLAGTIPPSWAEQMPLVSLSLHHTALCGAVPPGLQCFRKDGTNLGARARVRARGCMHPALPQAQQPPAGDVHACRPTPCPRSHAAGRDCATNATLPLPLNPTWCTFTYLLYDQPYEAWSGGSQDWVALQAIRAALLHGNTTGAPDPWPDPAGCGRSPPAGVVCSGGAVASFKAADVFNCSGCGFCGHPWRPVPEFTQLAELASLDLSSMNMQGARAARTRWPQGTAARLLACCPAALTAGRVLCADDAPALAHPAVGTLPPAWASFGALQELRAAGNLLDGPIPWTGSFAFTSPPAVIDLSSNNLTGAIPPELAGVEELLLHDNSLSGALPEALGSSGVVRRLVAHGNMLTGPLPALSGAPVLQELSLASNLLSGGLGELPLSVTRVVLHDNPSLGGTLPAQVRAACRCAV